MSFDKVIATRVGFAIVILWLALSIGLVYWQWSSARESFQERRSVEQQILK